MNIKAVNLQTMVAAFELPNEALRKQYLAFFHGDSTKSFDYNELKSLSQFVTKLEETTKESSLFEDYFFGYSIPQISKEFDLLRFGEDCVVNIELKSQSTDEKIKKQLLRNTYYLRAIKTRVHAFTFVEETKKLYKLDVQENLVESCFTELLEALSNQKMVESFHLNTLFAPSKYLVSPFNSTDKFIKGEYFLTDHQERTKKSILEDFKDSTCHFISVTGIAGSGKTLLTYDIAKEIVKSEPPLLIVHCGTLNDGHERLNKEKNWKIIPVKNLKNADFDLSAYRQIIVDEAQRIYKEQLEKLLQTVQLNKGTCIFSYDLHQRLTSSESDNQLDEQLRRCGDQHKSYGLTEKIRTNKEVATFIKGLFDKKVQTSATTKQNVNVTYFDDDSKAQNYLDYLRKKQWTVINFTPDLHNGRAYDKHNSDRTELTSHKVIGQEFEQVVAIVGNYFDYCIEGKLTYREKNYYDPVKMLWQNLTRTRKKLHLIVVGNHAILERCMELLTA